MAKLSSHSVCFTGPGIALGKMIDRTEWKRMADEMGLQVHSTVYGVTGTLVASRTDTVKARKAREAGIDVISYTAFLARYEAFQARAELEAVPLAIAPTAHNVVILADVRRALSL